MAVKQGFEIPIETVDKSSKQFKRIQDAAKRFVDSMGRVGAAVVVANQGLELLGRGVRVLDQIFDATVQSFADFETAMVGVQKTTNLSDGAMAQFSENIQDMSQRIPVSAENLAGLAEAAGQLGVSGTDNLLKFTETMAKVGVASDLAGEEGAKSIVRILNATNEGVENVDRFAASIVALGNNVAASESEIARVATELARSTSQFGLSSSEVLGISAAMKEVGIQAQLGGSAVGRTFREMESAVRNGGVALNTLMELTGQTKDELKENLQEAPAEVFQSLIEGLGSVESASAALDQLGISGDEINKVLPVLAQNADRVGNRMQLASKAFEENTALNDEAERAFATLNSQMQLVANTFSRLGTQIGAALVPAITAVLALLTDLGNAFMGIVNDAAEFGSAISAAVDSLSPSEIQAITDGLKILGAVLAGLASKAILGAIITMTVQFASWAISFAAMAAPIALVALKLGLIVGAILAIVSAIEVLIKNWDRAFDLISLQAKRLGAFFGIVDEDAAELAKTLDEEFESSTLSKVWDAGKKSVMQFTGALKGAEDQAKKVEDANKKAAKASSEALPKAKPGTGTPDIAGASAGSLDAAQAAFKAISKDVQGIADANAAVGKTQRELIDLELSSRLAAVSKFQDAMKAANKEITADQQATLDTFVEQSKLAAENAKKQQGLGGDDPFAGGMVEAAGDAASAFQGALGSALAPVTGLMDAAMGIVGMLQKVVDFVPQFLDAITNLLDSITELPLKISESFSKLLDSIINVITNLIPNLLKSIGDRLMAAAIFLAEKLPEAALGLVEALPEMITDLLARLPEIIKKLALGLVKSGPLLGVQLAIGLAKAVPKIIISLVEAIPEIASELVGGIVEGIKQSINEIAGAFGLDEVFNVDTSEAEKAIADLGETLTRSTSNVFVVTDLAAEARGLDVADRIRDAIASSTNQAAGIFEKIWKALVAVWEWVRDKVLMPLWDALMAIWDFAVEKVFTPILKALEAIWLFVRDEIFAPILKALEAIWLFVRDEIFASILEALKAIWDFVVETVVEPLTTGLMAVWEWVSDNIVSPLIDGLMGVWQWLVDNVVTPISDVFADGFKGVQEFFTNIKEGIEALFSGDFGEAAQIFGDAIVDAIKPVANLFIDVFNVLIKAINALKIPKIKIPKTKLTPSITLLKETDLVPGTIDSVQRLNQGGFVEKVNQTIMKFQEGGFVPGSTTGVSEDTQSALLTRGEFVVNRESASANAGLLQQINNSPSPIALGGGGNTTISVVIHAKTSLDANTFKRDVMPAIEKELKRKSQEGKFILSASGVRS